MDFSATAFLSDAHATDRLGAELAVQIMPGDAILLSGQIGAGKSHLARAIIQSMARAAGLPTVEVPSPTYTLVQTYEFASVPVWHADLYRLADSSEIEELGISDALGTDIVLIEWPDRLDNIPENALQIAFMNEADGRRIHLSSHADRWNSLSYFVESLDA